MIEANDPRKSFVSWQTIFLIIFFNAVMVGVCVYMIHAGSYFVVFYVLYIKQKIKKIFSFDKKYIGVKRFFIFDFETLLIFLLVFIKECLFIFLSLHGTVDAGVMRSLEIDRPFSYLNLLLIIAPQLVLFVLYVVEKASRNLGQKKILWVYNYNNDTFLLERYFIPLLTLLVYVLAFLIPLYFRNVLGVLYLLFILARAYLSIRSRINRLSTLLILAYFAFFITRNIWPTESLYVSFLLDPKTASFDFVLAIVLVDLLHDLGSFIHMYMKLKRKNLQIIRKQSSIYRDMVTSTPAQSNFKRYYLRHFERVVNKNFKKINSWSVNKFFDYQVELNCVFVSGDKANRLYDDDENREYSKGQLLPLLRREAPSREDQPQEEVIEERGSVDLESDFRETKSEDFEVKPEKKEETAPPEDEDESKSDLTEVGLPKKKRKKIRTVLWEMTKKAFDFVLNFPIWEFLLNIFGSDLVFYFYIVVYVVYFRTNPFVLGILLFIIIRNSFDWESSSESSLKKKIASQTFKKSHSINENPTDLEVESRHTERRGNPRTNSNLTLRGNERDTLFRYTYMYPAPEQDLSRPTTSKKTKFYSEYIRVVRIHFYLLVLPLLVDLGFLIVFNLKNDAQYFEHMSLIFGKNRLLPQYAMKICLIFLSYVKIHRRYYEERRKKLEIQKKAQETLKKKIWNDDPLVQTEKEIREDADDQRPPLMTRLRTHKYVVFTNHIVKYSVRYGLKYFIFVLTWLLKTGTDSQLYNLPIYVLYVIAFVLVFVNESQVLVYRVCFWLYNLALLTLFVFIFVHQLTSEDIDHGFDLNATASLLLIYTFAYLYKHLNKIDQSLANLLFKSYKKKSISLDALEEQGEVNLKNILEVEDIRQNDLEQEEGDGKDQPSLNQKKKDVNAYQKSNWIVFLIFLCPILMIELAVYYCLMVNSFTADTQIWDAVYFVLLIVLVVLLNSVRAEDLNKIFKRCVFFFFALLVIEVYYIVSSSLKLIDLGDEDSDFDRLYTRSYKIKVKFILIVLSLRTCLSFLGIELSKSKIRKTYKEKQASEKKWDRETSTPRKGTLEESLLDQSETEQFIKDQIEEEKSEEDRKSLSGKSQPSDAETKDRRIQFVKLKMDYKLLKIFDILRKKIYGKDGVFTTVVTNTDIYVVLFILVAAVFVRTSCIFLIYLFVALNYLRNIFFYFERKKQKYKTPAIIDHILNPFRTSGRPETAAAPEKDLEEDRMRKYSSLSKKLESIPSSRSIFSMVDKTEASFIGHRSKENEFISKKNKLELCYLFYKQVEYQRLLLFNIFFGVFYISACKVMILLQTTSNQTGYDKPNMQFLLKFFGFETSSVDNFGNSINFFVFLNMIFLIINKISIKNMKLDKKVKTERIAEKFIRQMKVGEDQPLQVGSQKEIQEGEDDVKEDKPEKQEKQEKEEKDEPDPGKDTSKDAYDVEKYRHKAHLLKYYSVDLMKLRIFKFVIGFLSYALLLVLLFLNILNENLFTMLFLLLLLFSSHSSRKINWVLILLISKLLVVYVSYLFFFDGTELDRKNNSVTLFSLFIKAEWVRVALYDVIIGKNFKLSFFFVEGLLILFFVFSQKIQLYFNQVLERHVIDPNQQQLDSFAEMLGLGRLKPTSRLPQTNVFPVLVDYLYCFYVNNIFTFLFGFSLLLFLFFPFDVFNSAWLVVSFVFFLRFEILFDYKESTKINRDSFIHAYLRSITLLRTIFNSILLVLQVLRFLASRIEALSWFDERLSDFSYLMVIFFVIILQNEVIRHEDFGRSFDAYNFFLKIRRHISIRLKVHETFHRKLEKIYYRLVLEENKKSNLNKVFAIIDHKIKMKKRKKELQEDKVVSKIHEHLAEDDKGYYYKNQSVKINPADISMTDEVINVYSTGLWDIVKSAVKANKYFYFNIFEQMEYMLVDYGFDLGCRDRYNLLCDFATRGIFKNPTFSSLERKINGDPRYIHSGELRANLSQNLFNLKSSRQYLDEDPSLLFVFKRWAFHWLVMNLDFLLKIAIILLCTLDASLFMKLPVALLLFVDLCVTVSDSRYNAMFYFFMVMFVLKAVSSAVLPLVGSSHPVKVFVAVVHCVVGDFSVVKTVVTLLLLVVIYGIDLYKCKESFYKYYIKHNIFQIFNKTYKDPKVMFRLLRRNFEMEEEDVEIKDKRVKFGIFKMKLVYYFVRARTRMYNFMHNRYLFNKMMGPNFRNVDENIFHPYLFKSGVELYASIIIIQLLFVVYNIAFWDNMFTTSGGLLESITTSELKGSLVLFILIVAACMLVDAILINTNSAEYNNIQRFIELPKSGERTLRKFKSIALKVININRIRKKQVLLRKSYERKTKNLVAEEFSRKNPTFPKFSFTIVLWLGFNLFLWVMLLSKKLDLARISNTPIREFMVALQGSDNGFVLGTEVLFLVYALLSVAFIRHGLKMKQFYKSDQLSEVGVKVMEKLNNLPYFRELRVYLFWTARKTTLDYEDWFTLDYCYFQMMERFDMDYESREEIQPHPKWYKLLFGLGPLVLIFLILLGPLVLFSSFNPINTPNTIRTFNVDFSLEIEDFGIFNLYNLVDSKQIDDFSKTELNKFKDSVNFLSELPVSRVKTINIPKISSTLFEMNPEVLVQIQDKLLSSKGSDAIKIHFKMGLEEEDGLKSITKEQTLSREEVMTIYSIFTCRGTTTLRVNGFLNRFLKVIAGEENKVIEMSSADAEEEKKIENDFVLGVVCDIDASNKPYIKYFEIYSPELLQGTTRDHMPLTFNIIVDLYSNTIKGLFGATSLIAFYVTFVLVMGFKIRDFIEKKPGAIRFETIVQNKLILGLIEAIEQAKNNRNFVKEKILYIYFLEIMRSGGLFNTFAGSLEPTKYRRMYSEEMFRN